MVFSLIQLPAYMIALLAGVILFVILGIVIWIYVLIDCLSSEMDTINKLLWALIILFFNIFGAVAYLIVVKIKKKQVAFEKSKYKGKKLYRSRKNRMIAGVCGGIGEFFGIDPTIIRLLWVGLTLLGGSGIIAYLVCWIVIPEEK